MRKYEFKNGAIGYNCKDVVKFFNNLKDFVTLNETGVKNLGFIITKLSKVIESSIIYNMSISEYVPVKRGFCPGIHTSLKENNNELKYENIIHILNNLKFRYTGEENYFELNVKTFKTIPLSDDSYHLNEVEEFKESLIRITNICDF